MLPNTPKKKRTIKFSMYWMYAVILGCLAGLFYLDDNTITKEVSYSDFEKYVASGGVKKIVVFSKKQQAEGFLTDSLAKSLFHETQLRVDGQGNVSARVITDIPSADKLQDKIDQWKAQGVFDGDVSYERESDFFSLLWTFGPVLLLIGFWIFFMRRMSGRDGGGGPGGVFLVGKSKAKIFDKDGPV
ncbi:MAG: ATP-dependent metallopeptidase FtsH/Yme1/Tma family protein, partial [Muribaculaceae bacterium]|nr:ATP-dependent metallopeptidase FtsH/Yme1/Tma family protein [Muribaculaceae bacterium]